MIKSNKIIWIIAFTMLYATILSSFANADNIVTIQRSAGEFSSPGSGVNWGIKFNTTLYNITIINITSQTTGMLYLNYSGNKSVINSTPVTAGVPKTINIMLLPDTYFLTVADSGSAQYIASTTMPNISWNPPITFICGARGGNCQANEWSSILSIVFNNISTTSGGSSAGMNISAGLPATNSNFTTYNTVNFNATVNASNPFNCSLKIGGVTNQTRTGFTNGTNKFVDFNATFPATRSSYSYTINCFDNATNTANTSAATIWIDSVVLVGNLKPLNNANLTSSFVPINATANFSRTGGNCNLYINNTFNQTKTGFTATDNQNVYFNVTLANGGSYSIIVGCNDSYKMVNASASIIYLDFVFPSLTTNFLNLSQFYKKNITGYFNFTDDVALHTINITIDNSYILFNQTTGNVSFNYYLSYNATNWSVGAHSLMVTFADGHTANNIKKDSYHIDRGTIFNDVLEYSFLPPYNSGAINIRQKDKSLLDEWTTTAQKDRYTFEFTPAQKKNKYTFEIEATDTIDIINAPNTPYKKWIVFDSHWMDLYPYEVTDIRKVAKNKVEIDLNSNGEDTLKFESIGDLNIVSVNYTFYVNNATATYNNPVSQLEIITHNLRLDTLGVAYTNASFIWNGSVKNVSVVDMGDYDYYTSTFMTPSGNATANMSFSWNFSFFGTYANETNMSITGVQQVLDIGLDNCTTLSVRGINFYLRNATDNALLNSTADAWAGIYYNDASLTKYSNITWAQNETHSICITPPDAIFNLTGQYEVFFGSVTKTYYFTNATISNSTQDINIYLGDSSTLVAFTVTDENDDFVSNAYITVLTYDFGTNTYYTSEIIKTDSQGNAIGNIVLNTQWYKFIVTYNNHIYLETEPAKLITQTYSLQINLGSDYFENYDVVNNMVCSLDFINSSKCYTYTFADSSGAVSEGCLNIYKQTSSAKTLQNSSCTSAASGTINLCIAGNTTGNSYIAEGTIDNGAYSFICSSDTESYAVRFREYGGEGILMTFLITLTLVMIGLWSPVIAVVMMVLGVTISVLVGFFQLTWGILVGFIILGVLTIYRLNK